MAATTRQYYCPNCSATFETIGLLASHMENDDGIFPRAVTQWVSKLPKEDATPAQAKSGPPVLLRLPPAETDELFSGGSRFRVWFVVDGNNLHKREIPSDETFLGFCAQLRSLYYAGRRSFNVNQFEYVLVEKRFHRMEVEETFMDEDSYHRMVRKLMGGATRWRHAVVRKRTVSTPFKWF